MAGPVDKQGVWVEVFHVESLRLQGLNDVPRTLERIIEWHSEDELWNIEQALGLFALGHCLDTVVDFAHNGIVQLLPVIITILFTIVQLPNVKGG
jgi:hypothetical protein